LRARTLSSSKEVVLDVGIIGVFGAGVEEDLAGAGEVPAQHIGIALIVEDFRCRAGDAQHLVIGAVGKLEAFQPVIGGGKPGLGVARALLDGLAEIAFRETVIVFAKVLLARLKSSLGSLGVMVVGITLSGEGKAVSVEPVASASPLGRNTLGKVNQLPVVAESVAQALSRRHPASTTPTRTTPILMPRPRREGPVRAQALRVAPPWVACCEW
jgi:hypothetical protein